MLVVLDVVVGAWSSGSLVSVGAVPHALARVSAAIPQAILRGATMFVSVPPTGASFVTVRM
ncbi:hypothetical protein GCM10029964_001070 [Kibdelosporangium lantanae]